MPTDKIKGWFVDKHVSFLMGAGCSACAGKPLVDALTASVNAELSDEIKGTLIKLKDTNERKATIEDLLNYLIRHQGLLEAYKDQLHTGHSLSLDTIKIAITDIQKKIAEKIGVEWAGNEHHQTFFSRMAGVKHKGIIDVFCLNYDVVIEASLEAEQLPYTDGFIGSGNAFFNKTSFENLPKSKLNPFRVYKLHGSINWYRDQSGSVRRTSAINTAERLMIFPCEQKYIQSQFGIYEILMQEFRNKLRSSHHNNHLIIMGYSFNDEHINVAIMDALRLNPSLTVYAFVGGNIHPQREIDRFKEMEKHSDERFNVILGNTTFIGSALDEDEFNAIKVMELWKFENLVKLLSGKSA